MFSEAVLFFFLQAQLATTQVTYHLNYVQIAEGPIRHPCLKQQESRQLHVQGPLGTSVTAYKPEKGMHCT